MNIKLDDGKYRIVGNDQIGIKALRYNEPWRDLTGDNLFFFMATRIEELEMELEAIKAKQSIKPSIHWEMRPVTHQYDGPQEHEG